MKKNKWSAIILLLVAFVITVISCTKHQAAQYVGTCDPNVIYFNKDILPLLNSNCAMSGCHDAKEAAAGYNFTYYYGVMSAVSAGNPTGSKLYTSLLSIDRRRMPKNAEPLSSSQMEIIYNWIAQGAKNQTCDDNGFCDTSNIKYSTIISTIIANNCDGCHSNSGAQQNGGGIVLTDYNNLAAQVVNGKLMGDINFASGHNPMPKNGNQLSSCDRNKIQQWINRNYPNN